MASIEFPRPVPCVLVFADRRGSAQLTDWVSPLSERYGGELEIHGIAVLEGVPAAFRPMVRALFRQQAPGPILMDWTGETARRFRPEPGAATLLVVCAEGRIVRRISGPADPGRVADLAGFLDRLLGRGEASPAVLPLPASPPPEDPS